MPVIVACSCGKQLKVADELVGKSVRCPTCQAVIQATPTRPAAAPPPAETDGLRFRCSACGMELRVRAETRGRQVSCPGCKAVVTVPGGSVTAAPPPAPSAPVQPRPVVSPPPQPLAPPPPESGGEPLPFPPNDTEEPTPAPARKRRRAVPWLVAGLAILVLSGSGFAVWFFFFRDSTPADLALVPVNAQGFGTARVADVWKSDAIAELRKVLNAFLGDAGTKGLSEWEEAVGLTLGDIERLTVAMQDAETSKYWLIFLASKPYDQKKLLDKFAPGAEEATRDGRKYFVSEKADKAMYFHSDRVFVAGPKAGVEACLEHLSKPAQDGPLKAALKEAAGKNQVFIAAAPSSEVMDKLRSRMPAEFKALNPLLEAKTAQLTLNLEKTLQVNLTMTFADAPKAEEARIRMEALKVIGIIGVAELKKNRAPENQTFPDKLDSTLNTTKVEQQKEKVLVQLQADLLDSKSLASLLQWGVGR